MSGLRRALIGIALAGVAFGLATAAVILDSDHVDYRAAVAIVGLALGWSFIGTGLFAWYRRPDNGTGALMVAVGFAWFVSGWFASDIQAAFAASVLLNNVFYVLLMHLLLAFPQGRLEKRSHRRIIAAGYFVAVGLQVPPNLFIETPNDDCENCPENPLLISDNQTVVDVFFGIQAVAAIVLFVLVVGIIVRRRQRARGVARAALAPVVWAGVLTLAAVAFQLAFLMAGSEGGATVFFMASMLAIAAIPYGFLVGLLRGRMSGLEIQNQQLEAALRARVKELEASRARIVEASDTARRRLERDLHDGAQQRLVALALDLKLARGKVESDPGAAAELLDSSIGDLAEATRELRELARGIHPALLTDRGLGPALDALASRAPIPVEVSPVPEMRLPGPVESAAYFVVAEALTNVSKYANASHAEVTVTRSNGRVVVEVRDDGVGGADPGAGSGLSGLADRVAALDGQLQVDSREGEGTVVRAEVPCE